MPHTAEFGIVAGRKEGVQFYTLRASTSLALTAIEVLFGGPSLLRKIKHEHAKQVPPRVI